MTASATRGAVALAVRHAPLRRLLATRLLGQFGDGVFQASLAGAVLFNPEHATHAGAIAAGFAVVLLPYSLVSPFAGVLLDRWWRQRVLTRANVLRALCVTVVAAQIAAGWDGLSFFATALVVVSINRFLLAALSASLPHVVAERSLVGVNAVSTTAGGVATAAGGAAAILVRVPLGASSASYAVLAVSAAAPYLLAGAAAHGFSRRALGPDCVERAARESARAVLCGLRAGVRHVAQVPEAARALAVITVVRYCYGLSTVCTLLLYRNYFTGSGLFRAGLPGLAQVVLGITLGSAIAALVTPAATRRLGFVRWPAAMLVVAAVAQVGLGLPFVLALVPPAGLLLGFTSQSVKITVDSLLQVRIADAFRGRVFSAYDTLANVAFVLAASSAVLLPETGKSPIAVLAVGVLYVATAAGYFHAGRATRRAQPLAGPLPEPVRS